MGLDMYLRGEKSLFPEWGERAARKEDDLRITQVVVEVGYWRKHPDLHGFMVEAFAGGKDACQRIDLNEECLKKVISAVKEEKLPHTEGFFFGESRPEHKEPTLEILEKALSWLSAPKGEREVRSIYYEASW